MSRPVAKSQTNVSYKKAAIKPTPEKAQLKPSSIDNVNEATPCEQDDSAQSAVSKTEVPTSARSQHINNSTSRGRPLTRNNSQTSVLNKTNSESKSTEPQVYNIPKKDNDIIEGREVSPQRPPTGTIQENPTNTPFNISDHMRSTMQHYKPQPRKKLIVEYPTGTIEEGNENTETEAAEFKKPKPKEKEKKKDSFPKDEKTKSRDLSDEQVENLLRMADMFDRMKTTVTTHDERIGEYQAIISEVENAVQSLRKTLGTCQLIWKIEGFKTKFKEAHNGNNTVLYSPAFETHPYGYKLALSMCPYGDGAGKGKYMSIFFTILQGQWDSLLSWPFNHKVTFTLMDQSEDGKNKDMVATFEPNPAKENMSFLGKPTSYRNPSLGLPRFAPLTDVWTGERFVKDDTIFIKVEVHIKEAIGI